LRNNRRNKLDTQDGILQRKRIDVFKGADFVTSFLEGKVPQSRELKASEEDAILKVGQIMIKAGLITEVKQDNSNKYRKNLFDIVPDPTMKADGFYAWVLPVSMKQMAIYSAVLVAFVIFVTMIKVWPIWLKILVWWISLILLCAMIAIMILRILVYCCFWIVGVRDIWLFPNFMDDSADFVELLTPLFGRGTKEENRRKKKAAREEKQRIAKAKEDGTYDEAAEEKRRLEKEEEAPDSSLKFGLINLAGCSVVGLIICMYLGLFKGENIPDFLANKEELYDGYAFLLDDTTLASMNEEAEAGDTPHVDDPVEDVEVDEEVDEEQARLNALLDQMIDNEDDEDELDL
jgi:hypothetical protein